MRYDERQVLAQGRGYKWGFLTMALVGFTVYIVNALTESQIFDVGVAVAVIVSTGSAVMGVYDILNDAFIAPGTGKVPEIIAMGGLSISSIWKGAELLSDRGAMPEGTLGPCWSLFAVAVLCVSCFVSLLIKAFIDRRGGE